VSPRSAADSSRSGSTLPRRMRVTRPAAVRRRRVLVGLVLVAAAAGAVSLSGSWFDHAVKEISLPLRHEDVIRQQARAKRLDPALVAGVIYVETKFVPRTSAAGAKGLMQLLPSTARFLARRTHGTAFQIRDLATPQVNIAYGSYYLRYLLDRYGQSEVPAIAAYNGGETNVDRWIAAAGGSARHLSASDIPFTETRAYVQKVMSAQHEYRRSYRRELGLR